jgi:hypothetical protein
VAASSTSCLTLGLGFLPYELYIFCIRGTKTTLFKTIGIKKDMWTHSSEFFLPTRSHIMTLRGGFAFFFFWFFWIIYAQFGAHFERNWQELAQNLENTSEALRDETRADMCIPCVLLFMWGIVSSFRLAFSVAFTEKKSDFGTPKMENTLFVGWNENRPMWCSSSSQGTCACMIWAHFGHFLRRRGFGARINGIKLGYDF